MIITPMNIRPEEDDPEGQAQSDRAKLILRLRGAYVFDVTQTDGQPLPEPARVGGDPQHHLTTLKERVAERGIKLDYDYLPPGADGISRSGRISMRPGLEPANDFSFIVQ